MGKKGVSKITGNSAPRTGVTTLYKVAEWYPATPASSRNEALVTWELFKKREDGRFTTTNIKKRGKGEFTFGSKAHLYTYKVEGYLHSPEGSSPMSMVVAPQKNEGQPSREKKILGIKLTHRDGSPVTKTLSYRDQLRATAKCQDLEGQTLIFTLWEDDEKGAGHNVKNQKITHSPPIRIDSKGYARWDFGLLNTFIALANKKEDDKKQHEYYVTAEYSGKIGASGNVNVNNPTESAPSSSAKPKPKPKANTVKFPTNSASPKNHSDPKGKISKAEFVDAKGNKITSAKIGTNAIIKITGENVKGKTVKVRIWEEDTINNDLLFERKLVLAGDESFYTVKLTKEMYDKGQSYEVEGATQEFFIEIEHLSILTESSRIDVGLNEVPKKQENGKSPAIKKNDDSPEKTESCVCKDEYKLIWGNKISCSERKKVVEVCKNIWGESQKIEKAKELMAIMHLETAGSFSPSKKGVSAKGTKYIGLVQFSETTAQSLGTTYDALGKMTFINQMTYVENYLKKNKDRMNTLVDFYLQVLNPAAVGKGSDPTYKVFDESISVPDGDGSKTSEKQRNINITKDPWVKKYGYASNPPFMKGDERKKRKKWVYTRQRYEDRYGYENGNTTIKEIDDVVKLEHYNPGQAELYLDKCEDKPVEKQDDQGKGAPWVDVAFAEFEKFKGKMEKDSPLKEQIEEYFAVSSTGRYKNQSKKISWGYNDPWCGAFVAWCFDKTKNYSSIKSTKSAAAFGWTAGNWVEGHSCEVFVGAIIIFTWSHVAIIVGENKDFTKYVYLGGNQTRWEGAKANTQIIGMGSIDKNSTKIKAITKPKNYEVTDDEKKLPKYNVTVENDFNSTR